MGNNPTRNPFRRARLGSDDQQAVDAYEQASIWGAWWQLEESTRRRYFTADERKFIRRYGAKLDELACLRALPANDDEQHVPHRVHGPSRAADEDRPPVALRADGLPLRAVAAARGPHDLVEYEYEAVRIENRSLRADLKATGREYMEILSELKMYRGERS